MSSSQQIVCIKMPSYTPWPKNSDDINQCVNNSQSDGAQIHIFDIFGLIMSQSGCIEGAQLRLGAQQRYCT